MSGDKTISIKKTNVIVARTLLLGVFVVALYLASISLRGGSVLGCGPDSNCQRVLSSRWSLWFGLPVSLFAVPVYLALFVASFGITGNASAKRANNLQSFFEAMTVVVLGAAAWFIALQWLVIKSVCPFCMSAHTGGVIAAVLLFRASRASAAALKKADGSSATAGQGIQVASLAAGCAALAVLIGGQLQYRPATFVVQSAAGANQLGPTNAPMTTNAAASQAPTERVLMIHDGQFSLKLRELPLMGSPEARHVIVSLFDYTCHHCRQMHGQLREVQHAFSNELAIISLPMPLDANCNRLVQRTPSPHVGACEYARLGLAVWRAKPSAFADFDDWVFAPARPASISEVRRHAEELTGREALERALADKWIDACVQEDVAIFDTNYRQGRKGQMPQLIIGTAIVAGVIDRTEDLYRILEERLGLTRAK
ncbi:MAG: thioredoxin domain-containing protein [Verrucomicrobia bacterium]|nr:thioredoxin domain-containing protein [Verrucomicrobiota bacterium]